MKKQVYLFDKSNFLQSLFCFITNSFIEFLVIFYGLIHSYHNIFANLMDFEDKNFYDDFWNATNPIDFIKRIARIGYCFIQVTFLPLLRLFGIYDKLAKLITIISICLLLEYLIYCTTLIICPILSFSFISCYLITLFLRLFANYKEKIKLLNILLITFGLGLTILILSFENTFINESLNIKFSFIKDKLNKLSFIGRYFIPKVFYLYGMI